MNDRSVALMCSGFLLAGGLAMGQEGPVTFEFSFSSPGARALGLGGAFAALADDATAAFANPAGLVQLSRPEISAEGRLWSFSTPFTEGGRLIGHPTGIGLDTTSELRTAISSQILSGLSFLSFVYPRDNWSLAFYRHQLANFEASSQTQGFFAGSERLEDFRLNTDLEMVSYGVSGSFRPAESLSLGAGFAYVVGSLQNQSDIFLPIEQTLPDGLYGENSYSPEAWLASIAADFDSSAWTVNAGFLWHISNQWNLGGFYRQGPTFDTTLTIITGPGFEPLFPEGTRVQGASGPVEFPDVFGLGIAYKSQSGAVTATFEWDTIQYSVILESFRQLEPEIQEKMDDGNEVHFGFEYVFLSTNPLLALRLGAWLDPDHRFATEEDDLFKQATFRPGEDQWHLAMGFGLAFQRFQVDLGLDLSELVDTASVSLIFSF